MYTFLRLEGLFLGVAAVLGYWHFGFSCWLFAAAILVPDLSMLGYLANARVGAICYNIAHSTILPWTVLLVVYSLGNLLGISIALIWFAHIGFDRALGYGLKHTSGFKDTHLGRIGRTNT